MALAKWAPFNAFTTLEHEFQSLVERLGIAGPGIDWKPTCDVFREGENLVIKAELPGVDPEAGLSVEVHDGVLNIAGEIESDTEREDEGVFVHERRSGKFRRDIMLPEGVDLDLIEATFDNGLLTVTIPVPTEEPTAPEPFTIPIKTG
jgi:HSP20 family protein